MSIDWQQKYASEVEKHDATKRDLARLRAVLAKPKILPADWNLEPAEARVLYALSKYDLLTKGQIRAIFTSSRGVASQQSDIVKVYIFRLRKKLALIEDQPITINTKMGVGYWMPKPSRDHIKKLLGDL